MLNDMSSDALSENEKDDEELSNKSDTVDESENSQQEQNQTADQQPQIRDDNANKDGKSFNQLLEDLETTNIDLTAANEGKDNQGAKKKVKQLNLPGSNDVLDGKEHDKKDKDDD